ncbi:hypothetical protein SAMN05421504_105434 [Amycolatopsis xylanica]|uniref:Uncharacterized protein n=1 Tax=Amycolatopsis xylanica TaxID=589385 RepID=A0A1H3JJ03_9PSEU|nr:hypothetical protein [Amycolatopsis xylanica]SDY39943.1 hypothetical protein SAMN05421504_105434 [Amycolatopsis xylanica]
MGEYRKWLLGALALAGVIAVVVAFSGEPPEWTTFTAEVVGVHRTGERTAAIEVSLPAGDSLCARDPHIELLQDQEPGRPDIIYANVVYSSARANVVGGCPTTAPAEVPLTVAAPLGDRVLMFNSLNPPWTADGDHYRRCHPRLGCHPPADRCDQAWITQFTFSLDVPTRHADSMTTTRGCDGQWLVLDFNRAAGECPALDGAPTCRSDAHPVRLFLRSAPAGWETVASTREAGCAEVPAEFPRTLCQNLPAPA